MAFAQIDDYFLERLHLLTRNEIVVYCYLVKKRNGETKKCNPKQATIARETNLQTSRVSEAVKGLESKGWAIMNEYGEFHLPEKVTESVTTQVTNSVRKSYGKRKKKLRNAEVNVTQSVTEIKGIENTREKTIENTKEKRESSLNSTNAKTANDAPALDKSFLDNEFFQIYGEFYPNVALSPKKIKLLNSRIRDGTIFRQALRYWDDNDYRAESIGKICDKYDELMLERQNGAKNGTGIQKYDSRRFPETAAQKREREAIERQQLRAANREREFAT